MVVDCLLDTLVDYLPLTSKFPLVLVQALIVAACQEVCHVYAARKYGITDMSSFCELKVLR